MDLKGCFTPEELQAARNYAAEIPERLSKQCFEKDFGFAPHVTDEMKRKYSDRYLSQAKAIKSGEKDNNFTIAQRMFFFLTGEDAPLFTPKFYT